MKLIEKIILYVTVYIYAIIEALGQRRTVAARETWRDKYEWWIRDGTAIKILEVVFVVLAVGAGVVAAILLGGQTISAKGETTMDIVGAIQAAINYIVANWSTVEGLARSLAADLTVLWVLAVGLAAVLKPFFPGFAANLQAKAFGVLGK